MDSREQVNFQQKSTNGKSDSTEIVSRLKLEVIEKSQLMLMMDLVDS